jgi:hypothetical protein
MGASIEKSTVATDLAVAGLAQVTAVNQELEDTVAGLREEWPTRTYEVVEGARAVAEGVVVEVRREVSEQLDRVRDELARAVDGVEVARTGLDTGTDRLSRAGKVLVAYLEERDRLLEAERDRVLHDVLDTFAAGLSARDRAALAGRVTDAVARRRDARDAERYRGAVGEPVPPKVELPEPVQRLAPPDAAQARAGTTAPARPPARPEPASAALSPSPAAPAGPTPARPPAPRSTPLAPVKAGPTKAAAPKAAPVKRTASEGPSTASPAKVLPTSTAPTKASREQGAQSKATADKRAPDKRPAGTPARATGSSAARSATEADGAPRATRPAARPAGSASPPARAPPATWRPRPGPTARAAVLGPAAVTARAAWT